MELRNLEVLALDSERLRMGADIEFDGRTQQAYRIELVLREGKWSIDSLQGFSQQPKSHLRDLS